MAALTPPLATPAEESQLLTAPKAEAAPQEVIQQQVANQDYFVLRIAVWGLILAIVISLMGSMALIWSGREMPEGVIAIGSTAVGALATMLVRPPSNYHNQGE